MNDWFKIQVACTHKSPTNVHCFGYCITMIRMPTTTIFLSLLITLSLNSILYMQTWCVPSSSFYIGKLHISKLHISNNYGVLSLIFVYTTPKLPLSSIFFSSASSDFQQMLHQRDIKLDSGMTKVVLPQIRYRLVQHHTFKVPRDCCIIHAVFHKHCLDILICKQARIPLCPTFS